MRTIYNNPNATKLDPLEKKIMEILLDGKERNVNALFKEVKKFGYTRSKKVFTKRLQTLKKKGLIYFIPSPRHKRAKIVKSIPLIEKTYELMKKIENKAKNYITSISTPKEAEEHLLHLNQSFSEALWSIQLGSIKRNEIKQFIFSFMIESYTSIIEKFLINIKHLNF